MNLHEGAILVKFAREAVRSYFKGKSLPKVEAKIFSEKRGVFVTLIFEEKLRGCIGFPEPHYDVKRAIIEASRAAAFKDPRFPPLTEEEFDEVIFEISILTKPELLEDAADYLNLIIIGKHGLIIQNAYHSGLLLPQVFTQYDCTPMQALEMVCEKAGLERDQWQEPESKIFRFEAQIFAETEPNGPIVEKK